MRIGFVSTVQGHNWPGSEYLWSACAEKLMQMSHEVVVIASEDLKKAKTLETLQSRGASVHLVPASCGRLSRIRQGFFNPYRKLSRQKLDLIVISSGSAYDPAYRQALGQFLCETAIPLIFVCHFNAETFWVDEAMRGLMAAIFQKAKATVFVSRENLRLTERQLGMTIPRSEIIVPPLCLNPPEPLPWPSDGGDDSWRLACVARLEPRWKGQDVLFEVLADNRWRSRRCTVSLFGQGSEEAYLRKLSKFYGLEKKVVFAGFSSPAAIWAEHHLQVLAARGEGGPMVITEGMICGRAAVTTRCGFNSDYIADGQTGFLAAFATAECFGAKMEEAWNRRTEWKAMGAMARRSLQEKAADFNASDRLLNLIICK